VRLSFHKRRWFIIPIRNLCISLTSMGLGQRFTGASQRPTERCISRLLVVEIFTEMHRICSRSILLKWSIHYPDGLPTHLSRLLGDQLQGSLVLLLVENISLLMSTQDSYIRSAEATIM